MTRARHGLGSLFLWLVASCGGRVNGAPAQPYVVADAATHGREAHEAMDDGATSGAPDAGPADSSAAATADAASNDGDAAAATNWMTQVTVWIGQVDGTVTFPESIYSSQPQRVVLILGAITASTIVGTVTFGDRAAPPPPVSATQTYPPTPPIPGGVDASSFEILPVNWTQSPYEGFTYTLVSSTLREGRLALAFAPSEVWNAWCALQDPRNDPPPDPAMIAPIDTMPVCTCGQTSCRAVSVPTQQIDLTASGGEMQGQYDLQPNPLAPPPPMIRLQRVQ